MPSTSKESCRKELKSVPSVLEEEGSRRSWLVLRILLILLAGLFAFSPTFHGGWLWDDDYEVTANRALRTLPGLVEIWTGRKLPDYFPLKSTFLWIQYQLWQVNSTGYHLVTIFFHLVNSLLVWRLFDRLGIRMAWIGGLLFCIHPIVVESVAWVAEQKNTVSQFFLLSSMLCYLRFDKRRDIWDYWYAFLLFVAAMLCKTSVVMLPLVLLLYCWWKRGCISKHEILMSIPFFVTAVLLGLLMIWLQFQRAIGGEGIPVGGFFSRLATAGMSTMFYLSKCILPVDLMPIYPRWEVDPPSWIQFLPWGLLLGAIVFFYSKRATWGKDVLFGFGFFLLNLVPVMGFITMSYMRITWAADHFLYLPLIGLLGLFCEGIGRFYETTSRAKRPFLEGVALGGFGLLLYTSFSYASIFVNEAVMWSYNLKRNPNAWQAHCRYAMTLINKGELEAAYSHLIVAVKLRPDLAEIRNNLGVILQRWNRIEEALERFREARDRATYESMYSQNLANALIVAQKYSEAMFVFGQLIKMHPNNAALLNNYGTVLYNNGFREKAIEEFEKALKLDPKLSSARTNLQRIRSGAPVDSAKLLFSK